MAPFKALYVRRSDGVLETAAKGRGKSGEKNQPTDEQLDQRPDKDGISDFYREVLLTDPKHLDWRRKLGGMLARQLDPGNDNVGSDCGYILACLPENYRLYEHVKKTEKDGKLEVKSKTHAAGGNDRQDAYLYGHPMGRKKRYRSPADFFPHLLWLGVDETGDPDNCSCKICCPEDLDSLGLSVPKPERPAAESKVSTTPAVATTVAQAKPPQQPAPKPKTEAPAVQAQAQKSSAPTQTHKPTPPPQHLQPTPLPQKRSEDQVMDSRYGIFMYRVGELVWFQRGQPWGLGVITRRWLAKSQIFYTVQPLSYPGHNPTAVVKSSNAELRPWLAWSVPPFTNEALNKVSVTYDTADWQGIANQNYGTGDIGVDGSILAAKAIDASYTLFGHQGNAQQDDVIEARYDGIFLGAEKIWVGEPVRLHIGTGTDIMVIQAIIDRKRLSANKQIVQQSILFQGDVYHLTTIAHTNPNIPSPASLNSNPHLPGRLTQDLAIRNNKSMQVKRSVSYWSLVSNLARVDVTDIKGRWYEATILLPILGQKEYNEELSRGEVPESSLRMNCHGDATYGSSRDRDALPRAQRRYTAKDTRLAAFGAAVPPQTILRDGNDPPNAQQQQQQPATHSNVMNLDDMEIDPRFDTAQPATSASVGAGVASTPHHAGSGAMDLYSNLNGLSGDHNFQTHQSRGGYY
ncbi:uncharacterized protein K489DRAFT_359820 [Dissoconium aciculare CBS 342.82]|uniref:Cryptic loci regulator 2 N-terminal domain-containing protein n=1 Tax=Dissoconium aciculare CBS 342.82 TaxID=1314786 RepID=A0A6J3M1H7_9PEZI|nr:uncharacterized protein K489DRAFT_359820 [Dissoconium aciculare CBS 342.82]KAF1821876.1 hypothetical protein K489DRAFT_359820 [Dissoconium aciculare CBS 342.82]